MPIDILIKIFLLIIPAVYNFYTKSMTLVVLFFSFLSIIYLKFTKFKTRDLIKKEQINKLIHLFISLFVVVNFFEKDVAIFTTTIALVYIIITSIFQLFAKIRIFSKTLEGVIVAAVSIYFFAPYLGVYLGLDRNVVLASLTAAVTVDLIIRWPERNLSLPFLVAIVAQFVKNSF